MKGSIVQGTNHKTTKRLKLLSYNVQVGIPSSKFRHYVTNSWKHVLPFPKRMNTLDSVAAAISGFDIVGLLELDSGSLRSEFIHQPEYVAQKAELPYCYHQVNRDLGIVAQHSFALLSRFEASFVQEHRLPSTIPGRGALEVHFGEGDERLVVVLAHLSLSARGRSRQLDYIASLINHHRNAVVMGDLNSSLESPEMRRFFANTTLLDPGTSHATYPSWRPRVAYDHIIATPEITLGEQQVLQVRHSDHLPVAMDIGLPTDLPLPHQREHERNRMTA